MITHITVEDAAKLISRLTNANEMQALTYIREAADRREIHAADALEEIQAENEKLRNGLEQAIENNSKLCKAIMTIRKSESPAQMRAVYEIDYDAAMSHREVRDVARIVFDGLMREDLRQRCQKED